MSLNDTLRRLLADDRRATACVCVALGLAVLAVYGRTLGFDFVYFDDNELVFDNPFVRAGLTWAGVKWAFSFTGITYWHPLTWLSFMLDSQLSGMRPGFFHAVNLLLHAANAVLLFLFFRRATGRLWPSAAVAALFALHPLAVESVAWVTERKDVLSTLFWLLTLHAYVGYARKPGPAGYLATTVPFVLGLMVKPTLITLPCALLLLDFWPLGRFRPGFAQAPDVAIAPGTPRSVPVPFSRLVVEKLPWLAIAAASAFVTIVSHPVGERLGHVSLALRLENALVSYPTYLAKAFWPAGLAAHYPFPESVPVASLVAAGLIVLGISALAVRLAKNRPYLLVGWLWFLGVLAPTLKLNPYGLWYSVADRFAYVPLIGLYAAICFGLAETAAERPRAGKVLAAIAPAVLLALLVASFVQTGHWRDTTALYERILAVSKNDAFALNNYGNAMKAKGKLELATGYYRDAVRANPRYQLARYNLALALQERGRLREAVEEYREALKIFPDSFDVLNNLGALLSQTGELEEARQRIEAAIRLVPSDPKPYNNLGILLLQQKRPGEALLEFERAVALPPPTPDRYTNLGVALLMLDRPEEARSALLEALRLDPGYGPARNLLTRIGGRPLGR